MNNDPEDPNDNPWDPRSDDTKSKRPTKKPTDRRHTQRQNVPIHRHPPTTEEE
jgi:hypothetical protein